MLFSPLFATWMRVSLVSLFLQKCSGDTTSIFFQVFLQHFFSFSPVTTTRSCRSLYCDCYCIPMSYKKSSFESSQSYFHLIQTVHSALLRHMLLGILIQPSSHVGSELGHQSSSGAYFLHFHRNVQNFARCLKKIYIF